MEEEIKVFKFIMKSGAQFEVKCKRATLKHIDNELTSYSFEGVSKDSDWPLYIRISEIAAIIECAKEETDIVIKEVKEVCS